MPGKHVLVVDDDPVVLESLGLLVNHIGHSVETAQNGSDALGKLETSQFDLVLTDAKMPGMNGSQLAREIKLRKPNLPIILISGSPIPRTSPDCVCSLRKPFSLTELNAAITSTT
jgi:CheY-like chemotaxis protein